MEIIRSRHNDIVRRITALASDGKTRRSEGEYIGAGGKLLEGNELSPSFVF